jgi:hypothetical protein
MPSRFATSVFDPELAKLMKSALQAAFAKLRVTQEDEVAARHHLAGVIVEVVSLGARDHEEVVAKALASLASAKLSGEWMIVRDDVAGA